MSEPAKRLSATDREVLGILDRQFRAVLLRHFAKRYSEPSEVEDMVQEVLMRLARRGGVADLENVQAYVFETAGSVLKDRLRKRRSHHEAVHEPFDAERHAEADFSPETLLLDRERLARATAALLELPERTRVIFVLRRIEGMKFHDVAIRLGISVSAVEKHMQRAIAHMARKRDRE